MDFYAGDGLSAPPDHGGVRQTLPALPRGDQFGLRLPHPPVHGQSRGLELCPPRLRQTLVPLGPGAAAGDGGADAPGVGRDTGTVGLFGTVVMVVQLAVLLLSVAVVENALKRTFGEER